MSAHLCCPTVSRSRTPDKDLALWPGLAHSSVWSPTTLGSNTGFSKYLRGLRHGAGFTGRSPVHLPQALPSEGPPIG